jgi:hypothetical protein
MCMWVSKFLFKCQRHTHTHIHIFIPPLYFSPLSLLIGTITTLIHLKFVATSFSPSKSYIKIQKYFLKGCYWKVAYWYDYNTRCILIEMKIGEDLLANFSLCAQKKCFWGFRRYLLPKMVFSNWNTAEGGGGISTLIYLCLFQP